MASGKYVMSSHHTVVHLIRLMPLYLRCFCFERFWRSLSSPLTVPYNYYKITIGYTNRLVWVPCDLRFAYFSCFACFRCSAFLGCFAYLRCFAYFFSCFACLRCSSFLRFNWDALRIIWTTIWWLDMTYLNSTLCHWFSVYSCIYCERLPVFGG